MIEKGKCESVLVAVDGDMCMRWHCDIRERQK